MVSLLVSQNNPVVPTGHSQTTSGIPEKGVCVILFSCWAKQCLYICNPNTKLESKNAKRASGLTIEGVYMTHRTGFWSRQRCTFHHFCTGRHHICCLEKTAEFTLTQTKSDNLLPFREFFCRHRMKLLTLTPSAEVAILAVAHKCPQQVCAHASVLARSFVTIISLWKCREIAKNCEKIHKKRKRMTPFFQKYNERGWFSVLLSFPRLMT